MLEAFIAGKKVDLPASEATAAPETVGGGAVVSKAAGRREIHRPAAKV